MRNSFVNFYAFVELLSLEDYLSPTSCQSFLFIPLKRAEIERFCDLFMGYKKGTLEINELSSEKGFVWKWFRCYERTESILKYWATSGIFRLLGETAVNWKLKNIFWIFVDAFQCNNCNRLLMLDFTYQILLLFPSLCLSFKHFGRICKMFLQDLKVTTNCFLYFFLMYMLQTNIPKLCYFVDVVLLIFHFLSYIVLQAKSPNRSILLNSILYGEG